MHRLMNIISYLRPRFAPPRLARNGTVAGYSAAVRAPLQQVVRDGGNNAPSEDRSFMRSSSSSSPQAAFQRPHDQHRHHQRLPPQRQQQDRIHQRSVRRTGTAERDDSAAFGQKRNGDDVEGTAGGGAPASCGMATTERLYELFEDALTSLVEEEQPASARGETVRGQRTWDSSSSAANRVGWVEVVRKVSSLSVSGAENTGSNWHA